MRKRSLSLHEEPAHAATQTESIDAKSDSNLQVTDKSTDLSKSGELSNKTIQTEDTEKTPKM